MTEIEAMKLRHSVRNYQNKKIEPEVVEKLRAFIDDCNKEGDLKIQFCEDAANTYNRLLNRFGGLGSAPSVIACVGKNAKDLDERIGYYGQKIVLYAQMLGLNTCWTGTFNKKNVQCVMEDDDKLPITIAIGYGVDQGKVRKSKSINDVARVESGEEMPDWFKAGVEAALMAPTAINQQKFLITLKKDGSVEFADKGGIMSKIDQGIVKYQYELGVKSVMNA